MSKHRKHHHSAKISFFDWSGFIVSAFVVIGITVYAFSFFLGASEVKFYSAPQESLALVAVAVANNVGTGASQSGTIPLISPNDVAIAGNAVVHDAMEREVFFSDYFQQLSTYEEIARIDIPTYLESKADKEYALESYIEQLETHTDKAYTTLGILDKQAVFHKDALQNVQNDIKDVQAKIEASYRERNSSEIINNIALLDEFVLVQQDHKYGQIFHQQLAKEYKSVIQFSENKLQVIKANIPAIVQGVTVNLPKGNQVTDLEQLQIFSRQTQ